METIAILSRKGGTGKTNLARSMAVQALIDGKRSAIIDADDQQTAMHWAKRREDPSPTVVSGNSGGVVDQLARLRRAKADIVFIDTPPNVLPVINIVAQHADGIIIVTDCYPESLEQIGAVAQIVKTLGKRAGVLLNKTPSKSAALSLARSALASFNLPICPTALTQLVSHPYASAVGQTAQEYEPSGKAARELLAVWGWVNAVILENRHV